MGAAKLLTAAGGGITLDAASTATDKTITIPARTGNMAIDGPAFSAYQSSAQTVSTTTFTKIQFQTEEFDTAGVFNNTGSTVGGVPAYAFLPTVAGYYQVNASVGISTTTCTGVTMIYKNGTRFKDGSSSQSYTNSSTASALVYLNGTTDYVECYSYITVGQALAANVNNTYFQASMVRGA